MAALSMPKMTVDEYLVWAEGRPGRYELRAGQVHRMSPERARHADAKFAVQVALATAIRRAGLNCHMLPDGMTVRIDRFTAYEPDALVYCGERIAGELLEVPNPVVVVEVLSPSTRRKDATAKRSGYFSHPDILHYLIVDPEDHLIIHHSRSRASEAAGEEITTGLVRLDPPGIEFQAEDVFSSLN